MFKVNLDPVIQDHQSLLATDRKRVLLTFLPNMLKLTC